MRERKYTLPRHTNLADHGPRIGAFLIDFAIAFALSIGFYFGAFQFIFKTKTDALRASLKQERLNSQLFTETEKGSIDFCSITISDNNEIKDRLWYFYGTYLPNIDPEEKVTVNGNEFTKSEYFTIEWFNKEILDIDGTGEKYFEVSEDEISTKVANIKPDYLESDKKVYVNTFLKHALTDKANFDFMRISSIKKMTNDYQFLNSVGEVLSGIVSVGITYIVFPLIFKNGVTLGKKVFGLCLADNEGYRFKNKYLFMRIMPTVVVLLSFLIPIWNNIAILVLVPFTILLVSFALTMASPKKSSLHDFTARTIVINARTSILFNNIADEEEYIRNEDGVEKTEPIKNF